MDLQRHFNYNPHLELTVAQMGVNKWQWDKVERFDENLAKRIMALNRYDILPIKHNGVVEYYFHTLERGDFSKIDHKKIVMADTIYYRLSFRDLLRKMMKEKKDYYFLSDGQDTLGFISINDLNSLPVYNYVYQLIATIEREVSSYLSFILNEEEVIEILEKTSDKQAKDVLAHFNSQKLKNAENTIFQYLFFPTLGTLLKYAEPKIKKDKPKLLDYRKEFCSGNLYWEIRNIVSHPVNPLFTDAESIEKVNRLIVEYVEIMEILRE